jgi:CrcB protein
MVTAQPMIDKSRPHPHGWGMFYATLQVALGGAVGSALRFVIVQSLGGPWAVMLVNVLGSFAIGILAVTLSTRLSPLVITGILGGFTTFSAFSLDALRLWQAGQPGTAGLYVILSVVLSLAAVAIGAVIAKGIIGGIIG